jgi:hypothetical protein
MQNKKNDKKIAKMGAYKIVGPPKWSLSAKNRALLETLLG